VIACSGGAPTRLDGHPEIKVVLRAERDPARAAAVSGETITSPGVAAVPAGIRAVTCPVGCVPVVKNAPATGRASGPAAEWARAEGMKVETVIVADDVALPDLVQPRCWRSGWRSATAITR
jgi:dihydroxyacetone kinase